jgi:Flp pilus assembly pilin Flp
MFSPKKLWRRRAQGMTEYVILVFLIGVLLVAAVSNYKETLDTAIQGSLMALNKSRPPRPWNGTPEVLPGKEANGAVGKLGTGQDVFIVSNPQGEWEYRVGGAGGTVYDKAVHGPIE